MQSRLGGGGGHWVGRDSPPSDYHNESNARDTPYNIYTTQELPYNIYTMQELPHNKYTMEELAL